MSRSGIHTRSAARPTVPTTVADERATNPFLLALVIIAVLVVIVWNLGAGLYYMMVDKGRTNRAVKSLTWRIGLSVGLFLLVVAAMFAGIIKPHGVG